MDQAKLRQIVPIAYGIVVAILWVAVQGPVAFWFTFVGGMLVGLFFVVSGTTADDGPGPA